MTTNLENTIETTVTTKVGDKIVFEKDMIYGWEGEVYKIYENSVIVSITKKPTGADFPFARTVVNHKRYQVISA